MNFWNDYPTVQRELSIVDNILRENAKTSQKVIENSLLELLDSGGKLLRPAFVILAGGFGEYKREKITKLGAAIEMLHMATLVHDDIIDDAKFRRGRESVQSKYGKDYAVFIGDYLFSKSFMVLSKDISMDKIRDISKVVSRICIGEIEQFSSRFIISTSIKKYLKRIAAKTAVLFALSFHIGAHESGCDEKLTKKLERLGFNIGMAFQIIDDILDYSGDEKKVGKPLGNDLKQGIFTLPLIFALRENSNGLIDILSKEFYTDEDIRTIINKTQDLKGLDRARDLAKRYTEKAFKIIDELPDVENKWILKDVTEKLLYRSY